MLKQLAFRPFLEDEEEKVLFVFRRPFAFTWPKFLFVILLWGGIAMLALWYDYDWEYYPVVEMVAVLLAAFKIFGVLWGWYVNSIAMTTEGLIFVTWPKLFHRSYERIDYPNLDEIAVSRSGMRAFTLNYGTVIFQKSNGGMPITWKRMSRPHRLARRVEHYREIMLDQKNFTEESALKDLLSQLVQSHVDDEGQPDRLTKSRFKRKNKKLFGRKTVAEPPSKPENEKRRKRALEKLYDEEAYDDYDDYYVEEDEDLDSGDLKSRKRRATRSTEERRRSLFDLFRRRGVDEEVLEEIYEEEPEIDDEERLLRKLHKIGAFKTLQVEAEDDDQKPLKSTKKKKHIRKRYGDHDDDYIDIDVEKKLDDGGGLGIDLDD